MTVTNQQDDVSGELNYDIWAPIVKSRLTREGLWDVVTNGIPPDPSKIPAIAATLQAEELSKWQDLAVKDMKALQILQSSLTDSAFKTTLSASSAKDVWDALEEGHKFVAEYEMLESNAAPGTFDDDMWMIYTTASNHMTPCLVYFTTLDRTHRARVKLADGSIIRAEGLGDVRILTREGMKTIKSVLFVPEMDRNVLSVGQLTQQGYGVVRNASKCSVKDQTGRLICAGVREDRGYFLRLKVVGAPEYLYSALSLETMTFDEDMWMVHTTTSNHMTPYLKHFTTLDRTHRGQIKLIVGSIELMSEGLGDVVVMSDEGGKKKKMIKNVLYVPGIDRNVLSAYQLGSLGYSVTIGSKCIIKDHNEKIFGGNRCGRERICYALSGD